VVGIRAASRWTQAFAFTHGQQHYRYGCFAQAFCGLDGLEGLMLAASPVFGAKPP